MFSPGGTVSCGVLIPGDVDVYPSRSEHVHVAISVNVGGVYRTGENKAPIHRVPGPGGTVSRGVLIPGDAVVFLFSRAEHVHVAISVNIRRVYRLGAGECTVHRVLGPGGTVACGVFPPGDAIGSTRAEHVHVTVSVNVRRVYRTGFLECLIHRIFGPVRNATVRIGVRIRICIGVRVRICIGVRVRICIGVRVCTGIISPDDLLHGPATR